MTFDDVREIALSLPEVEETTAYGMPAFKAGKTRFAGQPIQRADVPRRGTMACVADRRPCGVRGVA